MYTDISKWYEPSLRDK